MSTIYESLNPYFRMNKHKGEIGLEIETEALLPYDYPKLSFWDPKPDGSLRNFGVEYVLRTPLMYEKEIPEALEEFKDKTKKLTFIEDSITTSVHVHLNILNETFLTLANFLTVYSLVENQLIRYSGPDRLSNLFCLPMCDAEGINKKAVELVQSVSKGNFANIRFDPQRVKYGALNLATIATFGSLEIRSFRGVTDIKIIHDWITLLYTLMQYSRQKITPTDILESYKNYGPGILNEVFGDHAEKINYEDNAALINKNAWYAANIATATKSWDNFGVKKKTTLKVNTFRNKLSEYAAMQFGVVYNDLTQAQAIIVNETVEREMQAEGQVVPAVVGDWRNNQALVREIMGQQQMQIPVVAVNRAIFNPIELDILGNEHEDNFNDEPPMEDEDF